MALGALRSTLHNLKDNVHSAQMLTNAPIPASPTLNLTKLKVPRRSDQIPTGLASELARGFLPAEKLLWTSSFFASCAAEDVNFGPLDEQIILYAHGGAYCICSPQTHRGVTMRLSKYANAKVLAIDYRLSPQFTFPAALHDMISGYLYLIDPPPGQPKYRPEQVIFAGDSAGGNLCVSAALWIKRNGLPSPGGLALISPWMDLGHTLPSFKVNAPYDYLPDQSADERYINEDRAHYYLSDNSQFEDPLVSPLFASEAEFGELPPTLIQVGDAEKLRDESLLFAARFPSSSISIELYEDMPHVFSMLSPIDKFPKLSLKRMGSFIRSLNTLSPPRLIGPRVIWCRRNHSQIILKDILMVIAQGKAQLVSEGRWDGKNEDVYARLVEPLLAAPPETSSSSGVSS